MDNKQAQRSIARTLVLSAATVALVATLGACHQSPLHRSYGLRYREMMAAQAGAHPSHDTTSRGEEAGQAVRNHYDKVQAAGTPNGGGAPSGGQPTAGVMPLH